MPNLKKQTYFYHGVARSGSTARYISGVMSGSSASVVYDSIVAHELKKNDCRVIILDSFCKV